MPRDFRVIGTAPVEMSDDDFVAHVRDVVGQFGRVPGGRAPRGTTFIGRVGYVGERRRRRSALAAAVEAAARRARRRRPACCSTSRSRRPRWTPIVGAIGDAGLAARGAKVILEKPFGTDVDSAKALNARLHSVFAEEQIFRIDHFLGKEDVQDILAFRFANRLFEPIWSAEHVAEIQIDVPETLGVENRAQFYDATGAFRDMVVTHLFQALGFVTMEPPAAFSAGRAGDGEATRVRRTPAARPGARRARAVRRLPRPARRAGRLRHRDDGRASRRGSTTRAGTASRSTCAPASGCRSARA